MVQLKKITPKDGTLTFGVLDACCNWFLKLLLRGALEGEAGFPEAFGGGFDGDFARGAGALDYGGELAAEKVHPGLVERFEAGRVAVGYGLECAAGAGHLDVDKAGVCRDRVAVLVHDTDIDVDEFFSISRYLQAAAADGQLQGVWLARGADGLFGGGVAIFIVCHDSDFAWLPGDIFPHQTVAAHEPAADFGLV